MIWNTLRVSLSMLLVWTVVTGILYPLTVTGIAQTLFPFEANGSLLINDREVPVGSRLIGQHFDEPRYFWGRPSATAPTPNNALASVGSNQGPLNPSLRVALKERIQKLKGDSPNNVAIPVDLVTASGSGLDPEISIAAARYQISRIAKIRHLKTELLERLLEQHQISAQPLFWQEPRVNVLELNLALDRLKPS
jgi:K+-transporting ATPase ATPase C chain